MTLGKYYCDYCDKEFQDTIAARKRHLQGIQHQRNRALWYDSINKGANPAENLTSGVCNRFVQTGLCPYGDSCKYLHPKKTKQPSNPEGPPRVVVSRSFGMSLGDLPPSLWPPPEGGYPHLPYVDWG
ncbi:hypothetical protein Dimus_033276 [Dionaea muscipula]